MENNQIVLVVQYDGANWQVVESGGDKELVRFATEFLDETLIYDVGVLSPEPYVQSEIDDVICSSPDTIIEQDGMVLMLVLEFEDRSSWTDAGYEYDYGWLVQFAGVFNPGLTNEQVVISLTEQVVSRNGYCNKCDYRLKGVTWIARRDGLCDFCAENALKLSLRLAKDPLCQLRDRAMGMDSRLEINPVRREEIKTTQDERVLIKYIDEMRAESTRRSQLWSGFWYS